MTVGDRPALQPDQPDQGDREGDKRRQPALRPGDRQRRNGERVGNQEEANQDRA
jgi:hypothetical protein